MSDQKITQLTEDSSPVGTNLIVEVQDPGGSPVNRKVQIANLGKGIKLDDLATPDNNTDLDANATNHGLLLRAVAPAANVLNVVGIANGETIYDNKAIFDGTNPADLGVAAPGTSLIASHRDHVHALPAGAAVWIPGPVFARASDSSFTVTDNAANQAIFVKGRPIRYSDDDVTWVYGIVTNYVTGTVTIGGAPMTTSYDAYLQYGDMTRVVQLDLPINGWYEDADDATLVADDLFSYIKWQLGTAYCVKFSVIDKTADSGAEAFINVMINSAAVSTSNTNAGLTVNTAWVDTVVDINVANYDILYGESIEVAADRQGNGDARDLTVSMVFVLA